MDGDTPPTGEISTNENLYQKQIAATIAALAGFNYVNNFEVGKAIESAISVPALIAQVK